MTDSPIIPFAAAGLTASALKQLTRDTGFFERGGMPSGHTAASTALVVSVGLSSGFNKTLLPVALLAAVIIYDSLYWHSPREIAAGAMLGTVIAMMMH